MGKGSTFFVKKFWTRYTLGIPAVAVITDFWARHSIGVPNYRDPNVLWPWWLAQQHKIRTGEIPAGTPGYALCAWRNEAEERNMDTLEEYLEIVAKNGPSPHGH